MARRRHRSRKKRGGTRWFVMLALAVLIAGFLARRTLLPRAVHYLAYRPAASPAPRGTPAPGETLPHAAK